MRIRFKCGLFLILFVVVAGATVLYAEEASNVTLLVGRSTVVEVGTPIVRVSLTSPEVADALVTSPAQLLLHGKTPGTISMFVWDRAGAIRRYDVVVQRDLTRLASQMSELFPGEHLSVMGNGKAIVVSGTATTKYVVDKAVEVAAGYVEKKEDVVNLVQLQAGNAQAQVLLHVRFAEVSRTAMTELGASIFTGPFGADNVLGRVTTQQFSAPGFDDLQYTKASGSFGSSVTSATGKFTFSDFLNLFLFSEKYDLGAVVRLLQTRGLFESLAEPNLVAESGKEASFLAGGEIPVPVAQGTGGNVAISIQWKEFGIRLNFTPTVNGDRVNLKVRPEVSTLDFANAVVLQGFRIPALSTRRADTEIELRNNQTFAIAGLLNNSATQSLQKVPGIGDIPILGLLFQSKAAQKEHSELVVMITPEILPPNSPGVTRELPRLTEPFLPPPAANKSFPVQPPAFSGSGSGVKNAVPASQPTATASAAPARPAPQLQAPSSAPVAPADPAARPLTKAERKAKEQAEREERERAEADAQAKAEQQKRDAKLAEEQNKKDRQAAEVQARKDREAAEELGRKDRDERERQEKLAHEQAKRDAEQAKHDADAAKRDAEVAKRQAEVERQRQKEIDEAAAKLKAAEQAYQAELAKRGSAQSSSQSQ